MNLLLEVLIVVSIYYLILFIFGQITHDNSIVDMVWGFGFVIVAWFTYFRNGSPNLGSTIATVLVTIWGMRLTYHITKRNLGKGEDFRYINMRKKWGNKFPRLKALLQVYLLQMTMLLLIASAYININTSSEVSESYWVYIGLVVWLIGFMFEVFSDYQLAMFKKNPSNKGKILTTGLYKYSRHPNYFGEALLWWGIFLIGIGIKNGIFMIISPITITVLVRYVSGVPLLEKHYENREAYQIYAKDTPIFIPGIKRRRS
jgi:steroid 5-alpha reductase family enzyme